MNTYEKAEREFIEEQKTKRDLNRALKCSSIGGWIIFGLGCVTAPFLLHGQIFFLVAIALAVVTVCKNDLKNGVAIVFLSVMLSAGTWRFYMKNQIDKAIRTFNVQPGY